MPSSHPDRETAGPPSVRGRLSHWLGAFAAAVPCIYLSWALFSTWADPMARDGGSWVRFGVGLMVLEFVLLHSGAFMAMVLKLDANPVKRSLMLLGMALLYGLMAWAFSAATDSPALLWIFGGVVAGRLLTGIIDREAGFQALMARSGFGVGLYLLVTMLTIFVPVPEWGITSSVVNEVYPDRGSGLWEKDPERAVAGAAVYFGLMGLLEVFVLGRMGNPAT